MQELNNIRFNNLSELDVKTRRVLIEKTFEIFIIQIIDYDESNEHAWYNLVMDFWPRIMTIEDSK